MIDINNITQEIIGERYVRSPDELADFIDSPAPQNAVAQICADHHLNDPDRVFMVQQLVGLTLLGLIHDYDLAREINNNLDLQNAQLAESIAAAVSAKVFAPVKELIQKNYHPVTEPLPVPVSRSVTIAPPPSPAPPPAPPPPPTLQGTKSSSFSAKIFSTAPPPPKSAEGIVTPPPAPVPLRPSLSPSSAPPASPSRTPISPTSSFSVKISGVAVPPPASLSSAPSAPPVAPKVYSPSSFDSPGQPASMRAVPPLSPNVPKPPTTPILPPLTASPKTEAPSIKPATPPPLAAPVILHQESEFKPVQSKGDFHLDILDQRPLNGAVSMFGQMQKSAPSAPVIAKIQLGEKDTGEKKPSLGKTDIVTPRVVHYAENSSPFGLSPTISAPPPAAPKSGPPMPPSISRPSGPVTDIKNGAPSSPHLPTLPKEVNYSEPPKPPTGAGAPPFPPKPQA